MTMYYSVSGELTSEDRIVAYLRRLPGGMGDASLDELMGDDVIPGGSRTDYEAALQRLVDAGRVSRWTWP